MYVVDLKRSVYITNCKIQTAVDMVRSFACSDSHTKFRQSHLTCVDTPHDIEGVLEFIKLSYEGFLNNSQNVSELRKDIFKGLLVTLFPVS